jgi:hypothetical protein
MTARIVRAHKQRTFVARLLLRYGANSEKRAYAHQ